MSTTADSDVLIQAGARREVRQLIAGMPRWLKAALTLMVLAGITGLLVLVVPDLRAFVSQQSLADANQPPFSSGGVLGTDQLGRPLEWRVLAGLGISLGVAISVTTIAIALGLTLGVLAGFFGKVADRAISVLVDVAWAYPAVLLAVVVAGVVGPGLPSVVLALGLSIWAAFARIVRAQVLSLREQEYILAARALGYSRLYIAVHHLVPNLVPLGLVMAAFYIALAVIAEAGLSFIGLGAQAPTPSLGTLLAEGYTFISSSPWPILIGSATIILMVTTFNRLGDYLRDALDPHHKGRVTKVKAARPSPRTAVSARDRETTPAAADDRLIGVEGMTVRLRGTHDPEVLVVSDVSLDILRGQTLGIVGESGSGKSVTARALMGLLPTGLEMAPDSKVLWNGADISALRREQLRKRRGSFVSMVFQDPRASLDPLYPVGRQIGHSLEAHEQLSSRAVKERALEILARVGLDDPREYYGRYPHQLSGGQLQRAMVAAALILEPKVLIADEPTTGLDVTSQKRIVDLIRDLQSEMNMAVAWITHDLDLVSDIADSLVVMYAGEVVERGSTDRVVRWPRHPYTADLLGSRPQAATHRKAPLQVIPGGVPEPRQWPQACRFAPRCRRVTDICLTAHPELIGGTDAATDQWRCVNPEPTAHEVAR